MRSRPLLHISYSSDQAVLPSMTKKVLMGIFLLAVLLVPVYHNIPFAPDFLASDDWLKVLTNIMIFAIAGLGLNILTGLAGQVSLGHAFFMGLGAYTAAVLGSPEGALVGLGLPMWFWLPMAGIIPALIGIAIGPTAVRVRGLYLAIVTLGLVFIGEYIFRNVTSFTGGSQAGRNFPDFQFRFWKEETPVLDFSTDGAWFGIDMSKEAKIFILLFGFVIVAALVAKNIQRTRVGRAFQAIRDRDVAAEIMGVDEFGYKLLAFGISSGFAGIAGALLASFVGRTIPERWNLLLSVQIIAIILIGGIGTVAGTMLGSIFVVGLPRVVQDFTEWLAERIDSGDGVVATVGDLFIATTDNDFGIVNTLPGTGPGLSIFQLNLVIYGLLIIVFLIFEPLGLYGIWLRIRNYWKGWPFTY